MEKFCPTCGRVYPDAQITECEADGERLLLLQGEPDLVGTVLEGKYAVRAKLGEGGMGTVYLAEQTSMGREVAVKVLRPQYSRNRLAIKRFLREARAASRLAHPNTITVYDSGQTEDGQLYQVMEKLTGRPLSDLMDEVGALAPDRAVRILTQICDSLSEAHEQGIVHRDLKPENIFIEAKAGTPEFVKVLDFGIAKMSEENVTQATATGMICGTPSYMSPEQTMGRDLDGRSDLYALGVLLYEMLAGERPFEGDTPMEVMLKHINQEPPTLPQDVRDGVRDRVDDLLAWMLAKDPADRPADGQELKAALLAALDEEQDSAAAAPPRSRKPSPRRQGGPAHEKTGLSPAVTPGALDAWTPPAPRWQVWLAVAASVVLLAGGGVAWWLQGRSGEPEIGATDAKVAEQAETVEAPEPPAASAPAEEVAEEAAEVEQALPEPEITTAGVETGLALAQSGADVARWNRPAPALVELRVESHPDGARVLDVEGEVLGTTPLTLERSEGAGPLHVTLERPGYRDATAMLDPAESPTAEITLKRIRRRPAKRHVPASRTSGASGGEAEEEPRPSFGTF
ncbi:MAG: serine/threonine-protein kinase [Myxococcota bacterium]